MKEQITKLRQRQLEKWRIIDKRRTYSQLTKMMTAFLSKNYQTVCLQRKII